MRILAIRGKNLASLPSFEMDLTKEPLSKTRIFAIVGPTGAGKSTLLDAMCLALYDRVPRLRGSRDLPSADLEVTATDPRSTMRKGTGEAIAEVDFIADDRKTYRATWTVWRARKRASGKIQSQRMELVAVPNGQDLTGATKSETLARIEALVGLSFDEFRRAVLLAQGDFAAFLSAKPDERAELLEKMTGTEIYAEISRAAFQRAKAEDQLLEGLVAKQKAIAVLSAEERGALESRREELERSLRSIRASVAGARGTVERIRDVLRLKSEIASAERAKESANEAWRALESLSEELQIVEEAFGLRAEHEAFVARTRAHEEAVKRLREAEIGAETARANKDAAIGSTSAAGAKLAEVEERKKRLLPEIERATKLEIQIEEAARLEAETKAEADVAQEAHARASDEAEAIEKERERSTVALFEVERWLKAREQVGLVAAQWPRWKAELERIAALGGERSALEEKIIGLRSKLERAEAARAEGKAALDRAAAETASRAGEMASSKAELDSHQSRHPAPQLHEAMERLARELGSIESMKALAKEARRLMKQRLELERPTEKSGKAEPLKEADALILNQRALLKDGEPCPVCGSLEHPYAGASHAHTREKEIEAELLSKEAEWRRRAEALELIWLDSPILSSLGVGRLALGLPDSPSARNAESSIDRVAASLEGHKDALRARLTENLLLLRRTEAAREALDQADAATRELLPRLEDAGREQSAAQEALAVAEREVAASGERIDEAKAILKQAFAKQRGWERALTADPRAFLARWAEEVETFEGKRTERADLEARLDALKAKVELARAEEARRSEANRRSCSAHGTRKERLTDLSKARSPLLGGRPVVEAERALARDLEEAAAALEAAKKRALDATELAATEEQRLSSARRIESEAAEARRIEGARMEAALKGSRIPDRETLVRLLAHGEVWVESSRAVLAKAKDDLARAEATLEDRKERLRSRLAEHPEVVTAAATPHDLSAVLELARTEKSDLEAATKALAAEERLQEETADAAARIASQLALDDEARRRIAALEPELLLQRKKVDRSAELSALIGSADGRKFRAFAQGLTLDALLAEANAHLLQLRPRYRLERVPGFDMELEVIDRDMGDEIRAVSTLSGGETFLASLALALALSSISSRDVTIRSLFIDEGFASLDKEALEMALAVLDQLQASGRTIGIISHVPDVAERLGYQIQVRTTGPGRSEVVAVVA